MLHDFKRGASHLRQSIYRIYGNGAKLFNVLSHCGIFGGHFKSMVATLGKYSSFGILDIIMSFRKFFFVFHFLATISCSFIKYIFQL